MGERKQALIALEASLFPTDISPEGEWADTLQGVFVDDLLKPLLRRFCDESEFCRETAIKIVLRFLNILQVRGLK